MMPSLADQELVDAHPDLAGSGEEADLPSPSAPPPKPTRGWHLATERSLLAMLVAGAAWVRLVGPGVVEPNVSVVEVSNLAATETVLVHPAAALLGGSSAGASGLALLPSVLLRLVHPEPELALRLYAA